MKDIQLILQIIKKFIDSPFYPFARDSEGGVAGFFYPADQDGRGDIIINCSYTSLYFTKKENDGTYKYYENIIAWTARPEIHLTYDKCLMKDYRPKKVDKTKIDFNKKWTEFKEIPKKIITEDDLKKMKTLFCIDASGSVGGQKFYHKITKTIFDKFYKLGDIIHLWGSTTKKNNKDQFITWNRNLGAGLNGTNSELIAEIINQEKNSKIEHLIIITDGQVSTTNIDESDKRMKKYNIHFKYVSTYIIGREGNRTVGAPYCRGDPNVTYLYENENSPPKKLASLSQEELNLFDTFHITIKTYNEFNKKYPQLKNVIEAQMFGREADENIKKKLNQLNNNILNNKLTPTQLKDFNEKYNELYNMANGGLRGLDFGAKKI